MIELRSGGKPLLKHIAQRCSSDGALEQNYEQKTTIHDPPKTTHCPGPNQAELSCASSCVNLARVTPIPLLSQIELGVNRVSVRVRSIIQLVEPAETGGSTHRTFTSGCVAFGRTRMRSS